MGRLIVAGVSACFVLATTASGGTLTIGTGGSLDLGGGSLDLGCADVVIDGTLSAGTSGLTQALDVSVPIGGTLNGNSATIEVTGNWTVGGSFNPGSGTIAFVDGCGTTSSTISGSNTFNDLALSTATGKQIFFEQGQTTTVDGNFSASGTSGNLLEIRSTVNGSEAFLSLAQSDLGEFIDVQDNHSVGHPAFLDENSVIGGNADGWNFASMVPGLSLLGLATLVGAVQLAARKVLNKRADPPS